MSDEIFQAWHFDGKSAIRRPVDIQATGTQILLVEAEQRHGPFNSLDLNYIGEQDGAHVYGLEGKDGWRLGLRGEIPTQLGNLLPARRRYGGWIDQLGLGKASIAFAVLSAAAIAVVTFTPQWLAPLVPQSWERNFGDALVGDFGGRFCEGEEGKKALAKMTAALDPNPDSLQVEVAKIDMVNAVALPGGKVILFQGLLDEAESADEVAGVLGHEIGHVRERHVMQSLLRQLGLSVVLGGADGIGGQAVNSLLGSAYSRDAENEADDYSIKVMKQANISPEPTAGFFRRLSKTDGSENVDKDGNNAASVTGYLSSHPLSNERKEKFEKSAVKGKEYPPILAENEWKALRQMCPNDKNAEEGFGIFD